MTTELTSLFFLKTDCPELCRPWEYIVMRKKLKPYPFIYQNETLKSNKIIHKYLISEKVIKTSIFSEFLTTPPNTQLFTFVFNLLWNVYVSEFDLITQEKFQVKLCTHGEFERIRNWLRIW